MRLATWTLPVLGFGAGIVFVATCTDGSVPGVGDTGTGDVGTDGIAMDDGEGDGAGLDTPGDAPGDSGGGDTPTDEGLVQDMTGDEDDGADGTLDGDAVAEITDEGGMLDGFLDMNDAEAAPDGDTGGAGCPCADQAEQIQQLQEELQELKQRPTPLVVVNAEGERLGHLTSAHMGESGRARFTFRDPTSGMTFRFRGATEEFPAVLRLDVADDELLTLPLPLVFESSDCTGEPWMARQDPDEGGANFAPNEGISWNVNTGNVYGLADPELTKELETGSWLTPTGECESFDESGVNGNPVVVTPVEEIEVGFSIPPKLPYEVKQAGP